MAAWRYKISLQVLKKIFPHKKRNFISPSSHVMFYVLYISINEIPGELYYAAKGAIYYETIAIMVIFSRVKITCYFHV